MSQFKYSIVTFIFGEYDKCRTPLFIDKDIEYILVSDHHFEHPVWKVVVDEELSGKSPLYQSYYVRYHPFKYVHSDTVVVIDGSIKIMDDLSEIVDPFINSDRDMLLMCMNYPYSSEQKIQHWKKVRHLDDESIENIRKLQAEFSIEDMLGSIGNAFRILKNNGINRDFNRAVWAYSLQCGINGDPNRLDEIVEQIVLKTFFMNLKLTLASQQIIHSKFLRHYWHKSSVESRLLPDYDDFYFLCDLPISPKRYGDERRYPSKYRFNTEAILITKYLKEADMDEWIDWHLNHCGFEHIQIFINDPSFDIRKYSSKLDDNRVTIKEVYGDIRQYKIYNEYIANISEAKWVMPIDDDEYLWIAPEFKSIYEAIQYYNRKMAHLNMLAVRWKHLFPKKFHESRNGKVLDYCTEENPRLAASFTPGGDRTIKTIVRRYGSIHYEEATENPYGGHVPVHELASSAILFDGSRVKSTSIKDFPEDTSDEKIRLLHCRYSDPDLWNAKYNNTDPTKNCMRISDSKKHPKAFLFNKILPFLE